MNCSFVGFGRQLSGRPHERDGHRQVRLGEQGTESRLQADSLPLHALTCGYVNLMPLRET